MGTAQSSALQLVDAEIELRRETKDFARWTLDDVVQLHGRFQKTFGLSVTASQFEDLILLKAPETVAIKDVFDALDANTDGRIDGLEFLAALACVCRATFEEKARFAFDLFDFNHNGSLSVTEMALLMKSVWVGMALLTGHAIHATLSNQQHQTDRHSHSQRAQSATHAEDALQSVMQSCLALAASAFARYDKDGSDALNYDEFIEWARSNRAFMLQVEQFRLIAEKAIGFEEELSLPDDSDVDSDLDDEAQWHAGINRASAASGASAAPESCSRSSAAASAGARPAELPAPWIIEPSHPHLVSKASLSSANSALETTYHDVPPPVNLELEWIYGASGPAMRNTCRYLRNGDAVYVVSKYAIVYSPEHHRQRFYQGHHSTILCLDVNAAGELVATGDSSSSASAPQIHIWHGSTLQCLAVLQSFHVDGVAHLSFPAPASAASSTMNNTSIATGAAANLNSNLVKKRAHTEWLLASVGSDANSSMALWDWQHGKLLASGRAHPKTSKRVLAMILNEDATEVLVCGARFVLFHQLDGRFFKHKKPQHMESKLKTVPTCVTAAYYGADLAVVGTSQGQLFQFHRHKLAKIVQAHASAQSVNACLLSCRSMVIFTAGKDGHVKQWDSTLSPIGNPLDLHALLAQSSSDRVRAVLASDDLRVSSLAYDAARHKFLVGTRMGHILELSDDSSSHVDGPHVRVLASSHDGRAISCVAMARTGVHFASCGAADKSLALWSLRRRMVVQRLRLKFAPSAIAFSASGELLAVGGRDGSVLLLESTPPLRARATMKNTNSAVTALRFAPQDDVLAVACANGLIYLYTLDDSGRRFKRYALLKPFETEVRDGQGQCAATSLDFSIDSAFLKSEHGDPRSLRFWDLRQRACERVTAMNVVRNAVWHTYTSTVGWHVSGLQRTGAGSDALTCAEASASQTLLLTLDARGKLALTHFPCAAAHDPSERRVWLEKAIDGAHCVDGASCQSEARSRPCAGFALNDSIVLSTSCHDGVICQWRVEKEIRDVQPRSECAYDANMMALLAQFGLEDVYFGWAADTFVAQPRGPAKAGPTTQVAVSDASLQHATRRTEAPDLDLTLAYVYGMNIVRATLNQGLACAGTNGEFVYAAGTLVVIDHVGQRKPQRAFQSGLAHAVACLVKHAMHPLVALGSREDNKVVVWHLETQRKVAELTSASTGASATLISVAFEDASSSESDLAAAVWKSDAHVHSLVFYAWRQQSVVARAQMTRLPVLFGFFCTDTSSGESATSIQTFVTGGVDHLMLWRLDTACGHVQSQQGVFGRHALVQTLVCGVFVRPFVLTGTTSGAVIVWENGVAAHTLATPSSTPSASTTHTGANSAIVTLLHVPSTRQVVGGMQNGIVVVWQYAKHSSSNAPCRASTFLDHVLTLDVFALEWRYLSSSANSLRSAATSARELVNSKAPAHVHSLYLLEETNGVLAALTNGHVIHIDAKLLAHDTHSSNISGSGSGKSQQVRGAARVVLEHNQSQRDVALHPRDFVFATCAASGSVCVWSLHTNTLMKQRDLPTGAFALAYSSAGDRLAVSCADGGVSVLDTRSLEIVADFACGRPATQTNGNALVPPKWCSTLRYSPVGSAPSYLALACRDFAIYVYSFTTATSSSGDGAAKDTYELVHEFVGHTARVDALDFSLDGLWLQSSTSSLDAQVLRWSLRSASADERVSTGSCVLADDAWCSWTNTFAGPVGGLSELYGSTVTALDRIQRDDAIVQATESLVPGSTSTWSSVLPTMAVGTETGALLLCWYPLPVGDAHQSLAKEYIGFLPRDASVERVAFSFANACVVVCARNYCGEAIVLVWKTDFDDEVRQLERSAVVSVSLAAPGPSASSSALVHTEQSEGTTAIDTRLFELDSVLAKDASAGDEFLAVKPWLGAIREPSVVPSDAASGALPDHELALEFVYGVNAGATASNNVFYADDAWEIVYAAAAVGIVYNTKTQSQLFNQGHQSNLVSAMAVHPKGDLVATGECGVRARPKLVLWDANSGSTIAHVPTSHLRGIRLLAFAPSGDSLVSIGMEDDHAMSVFSLGSGDGITKVKLVASVKTSKQPVWNVCFSDESAIVTCGKQHILFWQPLASSSSGSGTAGALSMKKALFTSHKLCRIDATVLAVAPFIKQQVVSSQADGSLYVWRDRRCVDVKLSAHAGAIPTLAVDRKKQLVYSGGSDGKVCVWNAQLECVKALDLAHIASAAGVQPALTSAKIQSLCVRDGRFLIATAGGEICELLEPAATPGSPLPSAGYRCLVHVRGHSRGELWGLATHPSKLQFATAGDDGYVRLWDAPTRSLLALHAWKSGGLPRAVAFSSDGTHVAVGSSDGYVRVLTGAALETVVIEWRCTVARGGVRVLAFSPDSAWLAVGSHDQRIHVFDAHTYKKHGECRGHSGTVTHLDFSKDARVLQSAAAGAGELLFWNVRALAPIASASDVRDVHWATWSCPFGWPVQGIWPPGSDGSDINGVARSDDQRALATGDDDGLVRLLRYPSATPGGASAQARAYTGHASHVTNCAFTKGDMFLLSTGGRDQSVCQFKVTLAALPRA